MYRIKIYKHKSLKTKIDDDIQKIIPYFKSDFVKQYVNIDMTIDVENTKLPMVEVPNKLFFPNEGKYDIVMYIFEKGTYQILGQANHTLATPKLSAIYASVDKISDDIDYNWKTFVHEILHAICFLTDKDMPNLLDTYHKNDQPFSPDGNFANQLQVLKEYNMPKWKYFKLTEKTGSLGHTVADLDKNLVDKLDIVRGLCGFPFKINSGYRTVAENSRVGGVSGSAHTKRLAVDIACTDSSKRLTIIEHALNNGFIGIGIHGKYVHLDLDTTKKRRIWLY